MDLNAGCREELTRFILHLVESLHKNCGDSMVSSVGNFHCGFSTRRYFAAAGAFQRPLSTVAPPVTTYLCCSARRRGRRQIAGKAQTPTTSESERPTSASELRTSGETQRTAHAPKAGTEESSVDFFG